MGYSSSHDQVTPDILAEMLRSQLSAPSVNIGDKYPALDDHDEIK